MSMHIIIFQFNILRVIYTFIYYSISPFAFVTYFVFSYLPVLLIAHTNTTTLYTSSSNTNQKKQPSYIHYTTIPSLKLSQSINVHVYNVVVILALASVQLL